MHVVCTVQASAIAKSRNYRLLFDDSSAHEKAATDDPENAQNDTDTLPSVHFNFPLSVPAFALAHDGPEQQRRSGTVGALMDCTMQGDRRINAHGAQLTWSILVL
jgi:hypothetical protein